jgi:ABC-2 type transport system ATP-binding protein
MLRTDNLVKKYKDVTAVDNISFSVNKGEIFGLLGPNGAGKTTTIRTILNILKPDSGKITFNGTPLSEDYYNRVGYLPEDRGLYRKSKCIDVITYFCRMKNIPAKEARQRSAELMKRLSIYDQKDRNIEALSKGNQQKIQFIIAVVHNPELLVLDEPFSGFDPLNQELIAGEILRFRDEGRIIIISTHQMETAERLCSNLLLINKGKEIYCGSLKELKNKHKRNNIKISFNKDASPLNSYTFLRNIKINGNNAEFELPDSVDPSEFIRDLSDKLDLTSFYISEPSLHSIFIELISRKHN